MANKLTVELDKSYNAGVSVADTYGAVSIRVVVVPPREDEDHGEVDPDEPLLEAGGGPLDSYLERKRGEGYVVFLVNGQRHDTLDETFVQRELGFKYLRSRTMVVIDVDGMAPEAIAQLVQGSRQGFFKGEVYDAILDRVIAVLKKDPDLMRLEADAEQKIAELRTGDESVRRKLDELIQGHHAAGQNEVPGGASKGRQAGSQTGIDMKDREIVVQSTPAVGEPGTIPVLISDPSADVIRLHPDEERTITVRAFPSEEWANLESTEIRLHPTIPELRMAVGDAREGAVIKLKFSPSLETEADEYPILAKLTFYATFNGKPEPRLIEHDLIIKPKTPVPPPPHVDLKPVPTFLKVVSRQPVRLVPGGPLTHVRLRWDGEDYLTSGWPPDWSFSARCVSLDSFPTPVFSKPRRGNVELLLETPHGLLSGHELEFEAEAAGPDGARLSVNFKGEVTEPAPLPEPRKKKESAPEAGSSRKPPYDLKVVTKSEWDSPCWSATKWTEDDAGCFEEPNGAPLTLIINQDAEVLETARVAMIAKQLDEKTIEERLGRYKAHIYFHLYKMFEYVQEAKKQREEDPQFRVPDEFELRGEINRVAVTLSSLMDR